MSELVHRASSESLACTALVLTGPCPLRAEAVTARRPGWKAPRKNGSSIAHMRSGSATAGLKAGKMNFGIIPNRTFETRKNTEILRKVCTTTFEPTRLSHD